MLECHSCSPAFPNVVRKVTLEEDVGRPQPSEEAGGVLPGAKKRRAPINCHFGTQHEAQAIVSTEAWSGIVSGIL